MSSPFALSRPEMLKRCDDVDRSLAAVPEALSKGQFASAVRHVVNAVRTMVDVVRALVLASGAGS